MEKTSRCVHARKYRSGLYNWNIKNKKMDVRGYGGFYEIIINTHEYGVNLSGAAARTGNLTKQRK